MKHCFCFNIRKCVSESWLRLNGFLSEDKYSALLSESHTVTLMHLCGTFIEEKQLKRSQTARGDKKSRVNGECYTGGYYVSIKMYLGVILRQIKKSWKKCRSRANLNLCQIARKMYFVIVSVSAARSQNVFCSNVVG